MDILEVGALVRHPEQPDWGLGQIQSIIGPRVTVNFQEVGKKVVNAEIVELELIELDM